MTTGTTPTDEDLVAYLDGELDPAHKRAVAEAVAGDHALRERLDALSLDVAALGAAFGAVTAMAPPAPDLPKTARKQRFWPSLVAASLAGAILAGGAFSLLDRPEEKGWKEYVAAYQALYVEPTLAHLDPDPADQAEELVRLSAAIGRDIPLEALAGTTVLDYKRGQILGFEGRALLQFAFLSEAGDPYALCLIRQEEEEALSTGEMEGLQVASWAEGGYAYMLIGGTDEAAVAEAARAFSARL